MTHARVQWLAVLLPALLVGLFEFVRHHWFADALPGFQGNVLAAALAGGSVLAFVRYFTRLVSRAERELSRARAEAAVLAERQRIGRDMHDGVAQALFLVRVKLEELDEDLAAGATERARARVALLKTQVGRADDEVRAVIAGLKHDSAAEDPVEALRREASRVAADLGLEFTLAVDALPRLDAQGRQHLAAIVSEAMANAARHGGATRVSITGDSRRLVIADDGRGFPPAGDNGGRGFGLVIMAERAQLIGGTLDVESAPGHGARLTVTFSGADR
ncbi:MAG TPA: sensor histidine kinase [Thermodesulfobacteriota bacterium]